MDHDPDVVSRAVSFLQQTDFAGTIFCRQSLPGTFPLKSALIDSEQAPDIVLALRWWARTNGFDAPGLVTADGGTKGAGTHGSLSAYDMHNILITAGPSFRKGIVSAIPSGNADLAPTILTVLGMIPPSTMDGRVLREALRCFDSTPPPVDTETLEAAVKVGSGAWRQTLKRSKVEGRIYLDCGQGEFRN
jgi:hypothetical protein